ncbi:hypothetical protein WDU94_014560 [Cyamophila willieti]
MSSNKNETRLRLFLGDWLNCYRVPIILLCSALARSQLGTVRHEHLEGIARESLSGAVTLLSLRLGGEYCGSIKYQTSRSTQFLRSEV